MGAETTTEPTPPTPHTEPLSPDSLADGVKVDLSPVDIWVLGQLIEAGAASFPPDIENDLLNGYRILQGSGYEPPPTKGLPNVEIVASLEEDDPGKLDPDEHAMLDATASEPKLPTVREVVLEEIPAEPEGDAWELAHPLADPTSAPKPNGAHASQPVLDAGPLDRVADEVQALREELSSVTAQAQKAAREEDDEPAGSHVFDAALGSVALLVSALFTAAGALVGDPALAAIGLGLVLALAWLAYPYLVGEEAP